jgi:hypothetical protein
VGLSVSGRKLAPSASLGNFRPARGGSDDVGGDLSG